MTHSSAWLVLADGTIMEGMSIGAEGEQVGELVFNTAMTGYQEILTDPSYAGQLITLTAAHIGNTGCNDEDMESDRVWAAGFIIRDFSLIPSNFRSQQSLSSWLKQHGVIAIAGIDTRALTHRLRNEGALGACVTTDGTQLERAKQRAAGYPGLNGMDLAKVVSCQAVHPWTQGQGTWSAGVRPLQYRVVVHDFGVKHSILRILHDLGCALTIVPADFPHADVLAMNPDGIFLSNGPGDPSACEYAITATQAYLAASKPLFGICLGFQILALACGARAVKMSCGHHGANHPVAEITGEQRVFITSQNHGFAIEESSLPKDLIATHRSLFDHSLQGIMHRDKLAFGFQGHPEASPGPHDIQIIFEQFIRFMSMQHSTQN
ncbi:MAG: carbamoyl-phosphate synthase small subunit [Legionella sp.]|nr:MAG: carbamoyl-phosphate synthase small subunit [Legionella sp.]